MNNRDHILIDVYTSLGVSVDRITVFTKHRNAFLALVPADIRSEQDDDHILWRLVQLRKNRKLPTLPSEN